MICRSWALALALVAGPSHGAVLFVDAGAQGDQSGDSWENAFTELQPALSAAADGDQLWVACDTYLPTELFDPEDSRSATFTVSSGVSILGGFSGGEVALGQRDPDPAANGCVLGEAPPEGGGFEGFYSILRIDDVAEPILIDGFSVVGGRATGDTLGTQRGGGIRIVDSAVTLRNMRFIDVRTQSGSDGHGGAVFIGNSTLLLEDVDFSECFAGRGGAIALFGGQLEARRVSVAECRSGFGGGAFLFVLFGGPIEVVDSMIENNVGNNRGGTILYEGNDSLTIRRTVFRGNQVDGQRRGGAILSDGGRLIVENSVFVGNVAGSQGGALFLTSSASAVITNTTIAHNQSGGAGSGVFMQGAANLLVQNSVIHGNLLTSQPGEVAHQVEVDAESLAVASVTFSLVEGGFVGEGNLDADPEFVVAPSPGDGDWATPEDNAFGNVRLRRSSPAIDAGDNAADIDGPGDGIVVASDLAFDADRLPRLFDVPNVPDTGAGGAPVIDIGAFESTDRIFENSFESTGLDSLATSARFALKAVARAWPVLASLHDPGSTCFDVLGAGQAGGASGARVGLRRIVQR